MEYWQDHAACWAFAWDGDLRYREEYELACVLVERGFAEGRSSEDELLGIGVAGDCVQFVQYLLALDPCARPTVEKALGHPWLSS